MANDAVRPTVEGVACPFCGEDDFDLIGLKHHLTHFCAPFGYTPAVLAPSSVGRAGEDAADGDPQGASGP